MGHKEFFLSLSNEKQGFWLRYLALKKSEVIPSVSLSYFDNYNISGERVIYRSKNKFIFEKNGVVMDGNSIYLNSNKAFGEIDGKEYEFRWKDGEDKVNMVSGLERVLDLRSKYTLISPYTLFNGSIVSSDKEILDIENYKGMVGYISQPDYLNEWSWMHMSGSSEDSDMWMDLLITDIMFMKRRISLLSAKIDGKKLRTKIIPLVFEGTANHLGIDGKIMTSDGELYIGAILDPKRSIKTKYDAVKGNHDIFCYNSEISDVYVRYNGRIFTSKSGFLEYAGEKDMAWPNEIKVKYR